MALFQAVRKGHTEVAAAVADLLHSVAKLAPNQGPLAEALRDVPSQLAPMFVQLPPKQPRPGKQQWNLPAASDGGVVAADVPLTRLPAATQVRLLTGFQPATPSADALANS